MNDQTPTSTELALPEPTKLKELFGSPNGITSIIERIEKDVRSEAPDLTTKKGRDRIKSLAYKVAQSKTTLDKAGKELNEAARAEIAKVDEQRRNARDRLDNLRDEVRKPLEDWQDAENKRVEEHKKNLKAFDVSRVTATMGSGDIKAAMDEVSAIQIDESWEEFQEFAEASKAECLTAWGEHLTIAKEREEQAAEIARLKAEAEERARKDEEERQRVAAEEAKRREKEEAERQKREAAEAEERRKVELENARAEAAERAKQEAAEEAKRKQEEHERELAEAKRREEEAAENERLRLAKEREEEERARKKREADKAHRNRIQSDIAEAVASFPHEGIAAAIMDGRIPHVRVML